MRYDILNQTPAPPGWFVYYFSASDRKVWSLPVAMWVLVEKDAGSYGDGDDDEIHYRPYVVGKLGQVIDYRAHADDVLCVLPPGISHEPYVVALLKERGSEDATIAN